MVLCVHGEVTDPDVDVFDREAVFIDRVLRRLVRDFPELKIVFEHITTAEAVAFRRGRGPNIARDGHAAASDHQPQRHVRRRAAGPTLIACRSPSASSTGSRCARRRLRARPNSSSAPTARRTRAKPRKAACGCAGIFNAPFALESYATVFDEEGALDRLEAFASSNGARFYGLPLNEGTVTLERDGPAGSGNEIAWARAVPCRRDAALAAGPTNQQPCCRRFRWCR